MHATRIRTPLGIFIAYFSQQGLARLEFPSDESARGNNPNHFSAPAAWPPETQIRRWHRQTEQALKRTLAGKSPETLPPLDLSAGSPFQQEVWKAMLRIPTGATKSYAEIAGEIHRPKATRAVGNACGANPIPVLIPCHRVVASGGGLGGFSCGLHWKERLLKNEGVQLKLR